MTHDRQIEISTGESRKSTTWTPTKMLWSQLAHRLQEPLRSKETLAQYLALPAGEQAELKDRGGFVGGTLREGRRRAADVLARDVLALDLDNIPAGGAEEALRRVEGMGAAYIVYSTRKHCPQAPRLRVLVLLDQSCTAEEYEPLARRYAQQAGVLPWADPTTFEASRLMYWPTACAGGEYLYRVGDHPMLCRDEALAGYDDWRDVAAWPRVPGEERKAPRAAMAAAAGCIASGDAIKQGDPTAKGGIVGAFCRCFDVYRAMEELLSGVYEPTDTPARYTYTGGSTAGGAVVYEGGKFLYSHHATDPCCGQLVNAYDLVRRHLFLDRDEEALPGTPTNRLPSVAAMNELALSIPGIAVAAAPAEQASGPPAQDARASSACKARPTPDNTEGTESAPPPDDEDDQQWMGQLSTNPQTGAILRTSHNVVVLLEHDPQLRGRVLLDEFSQRKLVVGDLPWLHGRAGAEVPDQPWSRHKGVSRVWSDYDDAQIITHLGHKYGLGGPEKVRMGLMAALDNHRINVVTDWFATLHWDGTPRLETLFTDYLGAADTPYVRAVSRKSICAAVARAYAPGIKYDYVPVLRGGQGIGKSTLLRILAGEEWFCDSLEVFDGKEAAELIQGRLIIELGELKALSRSDEAAAKHFLSKTDDQFRAAYGREVMVFPRRCVFFGTTNVPDFLRDPTGNRRFWPVECMAQRPTKGIFTDLPREREQIWAEAVVRWTMLDEQLYLPPELEAIARGAQDEHREDDPRQGIVADWLEQKVPRDWLTRTLDQRLAYWAGEYGTPREDAADLVRRQTVSRQEIWVECFHRRPEDFHRREATEISALLDVLPGWERLSAPYRNGPYGVERGYRRREIARM